MVTEFLYWVKHPGHWVLLKNRHRLGGVHLLWGSHFPFDDSNYPDNRQQAMRVTDEVPDDERQALLADNVARLYRLPGYDNGFTSDEVGAFEQLVHFSPGGREREVQQVFQGDRGVEPLADLLRLVRDPGEQSPTLLHGRGPMGEERTLLDERGEAHPVESAELLGESHGPLGPVAGFVVEVA